LEPDEILLVVNRNMAEGKQLAEFYRTARGIPEGRVVELDLPRGEEMTFAVYEREMVPPLRQFLRENKLEQKIQCLVTFYGVPLRIAEHVLTAEEKQEVAELERQEKRLLEEARKLIVGLEGQARSLDGQFKALSGEEAEKLAARGEAAIRFLGQQAGKMPEGPERQPLIQTITQAMAKLSGPAGVLRAAVVGKGQQDAPTQEAMRNLAEQVRKAGEEMVVLQERRNDRESRSRMRQLAGDGYGMLDQARVVRSHLDYLSSGSTMAAVDSELALLWWSFYKRSQWQANTLSYQMPEGLAAPRTLMVMRLDAPQAGMVRDLILMSLKAERDGLKGRVVLDGRGLAPRGESIKSGGYAWYDQSISRLAELVRTKTKLPLLYDESPTVLAAGSAKDVALYCGWYSVRNYVPACQFNPGAVGFHIASFEMVSLRNPQEKGWVRGLLNDGVAATLGPVHEPFLAAFPLADDFFPLLLTGKLTLAEVYWKSAPTASWMMSMIGDPLYVPYKTNPALRIQDLPVRLRGVFDRPATQPAGMPGQ
jgi:uncharacterized protein (TIGR03790 family)